MMKKGMPKVTAEEKKSLFRDLEHISAKDLLGDTQKGGRAS